jgi:hypothetical protein
MTTQLSPKCLILAVLTITAIAAGAPAQDPSAPAMALVTPSNTLAASLKVA